MYILIFSTAKNDKEGERISRALLGEKLAACVNIIKDVRSFYWWKGKIESSQEVMLVIKSKKALFKRIITVIKRVHSYEVPEIIAMPVVMGEKGYLKWLGESVLNKS